MNKPEALPTEDQFYIVSVKHTMRRDRYITFWRPSDAGYAYPLSWAGRYHRAGVLARTGYYNDGISTVAVPCSVVDPLGVDPIKGTVDNDAGPVVLNNAANWRTLLNAVIEPPTWTPEPQYKGARRSAHG